MKRALFNFGKNINQKNTGFTIVELLVVIVVIGIIAAIVTVSYSGVISKAIVATLKSDLSNAKRSLQMFAIDHDNSNFPLTIDCSIPDSSTNKCIKFSSDIIHTYIMNSSLNTFCLELSKDGKSYNLDQNNNLLAGPCASSVLDAQNKISYPGIGDTWYDISGNNYNVTLINSPTYISDEKYFSFNGIDQYATHNFPAFNTGTQNYYIEIWFKMRTLHTVQYGANGHIYGGRNGDNLALYVNTAVAGTSNLNMVYDDSRYSTLHDTNYELTPNSWVCWGINGYMTSDIEYYVNGELDKARFTSSQGPKAWQGLANIAYDSRWGSYSELDVAIIKVYNKNLTAEEIKYNFNEKKNSFGL